MNIIQYYCICYGEVFMNIKIKKIADRFEKKLIKISEEGEVVDFEVDTIKSKFNPNDKLINSLTDLKIDPKLLVKLKNEFVSKKDVFLFLPPDYKEGIKILLNLLEKVYTAFQKNITITKPIYSQKFTLEDIKNIEDCATKNRDALKSRSILEYDGGLPFHPIEYIQKIINYKESYNNWKKDLDANQGGVYTYKTENGVNEIRPTEYFDTELLKEASNGVSQYSESNFQLIREINHLVWLCSNMSLEHEFMLRDPKNLNLKKQFEQTKKNNLPKIIASLKKIGW